MSDLKRTGGCLCGAVRLETTLCEAEVHVCHCTICSKWHGGPGFALKCEKGWTITGEENMSWFASSEWGNRSFCKKCGTHLLFKTNDESYFGLAAGALDNQDGLKIGMHIFDDKKQPYLNFADKSPRLTEQEFLEMVGATE